MKTSETNMPTKKTRSFVGNDFNPNEWASLEPYFTELLQREVNSVDDLNRWLKDWSELDTAMTENSRWIYVKTTVDTNDEKAKADLANQYQNIFPRYSPIENQLKKKLVSSPFVDQLDQSVFFPTLRRLKMEIELFREENIPLQSELQLKQSTYDAIAGAESINYNGSELTFQQASIYLKSTDHAQREDVYRKISERRLQDADTFDKLLSELIQLRHKIALNAGYKNYVEYRFNELGRFDYNSQDCLNFHKAVEELIVPIKNQMAEERRKLLGLESLKPWDMDVDTSGKAPLQPVKNTEELIDKTISCFNRLDPYFGQRIEIMKKMNYLDLESRMHKGPGGYNMTMPEIGVPFIFMNSANDEHDLITMVHEGGHAIHTFLAHELELMAFKETTSEVAEVASMGMELMSMEHWDLFYSNPDDLRRAKVNHLRYTLAVLTKTCLGDSFQHWLYLNPNHTIEERRAKWAELSSRFGGAGINWNGLEKDQQTGYHRILHFFVVPFYYIEYAFAQLGAIALWRSFKKDPKKAVNDYKNALSLGYTKPIPVFYETAGAKFDFSKDYVASLVDFVNAELKKLA
ncbi:MAG: M3 family oligoendopeptidase [Chitinophagales bacterium]